MWEREGLERIHPALTNTTAWLLVFSCGNVEYGEIRADAPPLFCTTNTEESQGGEHKGELSKPINDFEAGEELKKFVVEGDGDVIGAQIGIVLVRGTI